MRAKTYLLLLLSFSQDIIGDGLPVDKEFIKQQILENLRNVLDPEIGLNVVEAGFIRNISIDDEGNVLIEIMLTSPFCPLTFFLTHNIKSAASNVKGVKSVEVKVVGFGIPPELERRLKRQD